MSLTDTHGTPLAVGDPVQATHQPGKDKMGKVEKFVDMEPEEGVFSGQFTGLIVVDYEGYETEEYPTYAAGGQDWCPDLISRKEAE